MADEISFSVGVIKQVPNSKIFAIRIQDGTTGLWYNWDVGSDGIGRWDVTPKCNEKANLYIAAYAKNLGGDGNIVLTIRNNLDGAYARSSFSVPANNVIGAEINYTMPNQSPTITIKSTD